MKDGDLTITKYITSQEVHVEFVDTGYETVARAQHIVAGSVKDRSIKPKRVRIQERKARARKGTFYAVICNDGYTSIFKSVREVAETYGIKPSSIYSHLRGETDSRAFASITKSK
ncbi:MAG: hypothetical protein ACRDCE_22835 [Cetobacterium sp.]|uniref:hypothetical protein n=1 Tax=Cetobacterium sp. TaxID=2071632 RepID=UPI003EE43E79